MIYDLTQSFEYNVTYGPFWDEKIPPIKENPKLKTSLFGFKLNSPFGVSANPLTHGSRNIKLMSELGYDLITYRSVRSKEWHGQKYPHLQYVDVSKPLSVEQLNDPVTASFEPFTGQPSMANSFGIQSLKPEYWQADVEQTHALLKKGQLLILGMMFTPEEGKDVLQDAQDVARYAKETSTQVFEINLAHPNSGMKSLVYEDIETSVAICKAVKKVLKDRYLIAKIGFYKQPGQLREFLKRTQGVIDGISSTNTYSMPVINELKEEAFPARPKVAVSGTAVRKLSQQQAKEIVRLKEELKLPELVVIGIGGVTKPVHIDEYLKLGVDAVQSAVGVITDPFLAIKYKERLV